MNSVIKVSGGVIGDFLKNAIQSQEYADVALCCDGGQRFLAHRLILSAASPYLHEVLRAHGTINGQCEIITIILAEVEGNDLEAILGFLYTGCVMIPKSRLKAFSSAADALKIKIPPLPLSLTQSTSPTDHFNYYNYLEYQSNIEENDNGNHLTINDVIGNFPNNIACPKELLTSRDCHDNADDYCINLKLPKLSSNEVMKFKSHVANRVIASPWCQLARPYHSPKVQPILQQNYNVLSTDINCKIIPLSGALSSTVPHYSSLTREWLKGPLSETTVDGRLSYNNDNYDSSNAITLDYPQDMTKSTKMTLTSEVIQNDNYQSTGTIIESSKNHLSLLLDECELKFQSDQSFDITPTNLNNTINSGFLKNDDNKNISSSTVQAISWIDGNNNNSVNSKNGKITFTNDKHYKCHICKKTFINRTSLKVHSRCHSGEKPFRCLDCGKEFSQLRNYKYHRSMHEGTGEFSATCPECGKCFNDRGYLGSHMKIHMNKKEYACEECGKSFNQRVAYNMHVRIHTGVKPHHCEQCGKSFSRKMLLKQHLRTHSGERPYQCHICHKAFSDRSNMTLHTRLHSGLKPYQCDICSKAFTKKHHLKTHLNYHTGTKPYSCPNCLVTFSQSSNMRTHYKKCVVNKPDSNVSNKVES